MKAEVVKSCGCLMREMKGPLNFVWLGVGREEAQLWLRISWLLPVGVNCAAAANSEPFNAVLSWVELGCFAWSLVKRLQTATYIITTTGSSCHCSQSSS